MNRKCQLPIQDDVSVYTYTYYGFANSIIQANAYSDNCIVKFEIVDKLQHNWTVNLHNFDVKKETDGKVIELFSNVPFRQNLLGVISRNLEEVDSIRVRIYSQQYAHPWGAVNYR